MFAGVSTYFVCTCLRVSYRYIIRISIRIFSFFVWCENFKKQHGCDVFHIHLLSVVSVYFLFAASPHFFYVFFTIKFYVAYTNSSTYICVVYTFVFMRLLEIQLMLIFFLVFYFKYIPCSTIPAKFYYKDTTTM